LYGHHLLRAYDGVELSSSSRSSHYHFFNPCQQRAWNEVGAVGTDENGRRTVTMKCINDKKVRHDGTNKSDSNFNVYQDIQMKNIYACTQLTLMGYNGDILKIMFKEIRSEQDWKQSHQSHNRNHSHAKKLLLVQSRPVKDSLPLEVGVWSTQMRRSELWTLKIANLKLMRW
jgi:hypothetical protein